MKKIFFCSSMGLQVMAKEMQEFGLPNRLPAIT